LLSYLHRFAAPPLSDTKLLARWRDQRDEDAFACLMARHGPMVLGVCRRILGDVQDAEDAFQATFLVLARKVAQLRRPEALVSFLYGVAVRLARKAHASAKCRKMDQPSAETPEPVDPRPQPLDVLTGRELLAFLDAEIARLPETYRLPLLLCLLQGKTVEEAARQLDCSIGSLRGRLERGREQLRRRLSRRGLGLSVGAIALLAPAVVPEKLLAESLRHLSGPVPAAVSALAGEMMPAVNLKTLGLALALVTAVGLGAGLSLQSTPAPQTPVASVPAEPQTQAKAEPRRDRYGDPLPPGALTRLGTIRLRHGGHVKSVAFTPDGKSVVSGGFDGWAVLWDVRTGKRLRQFRGGTIQSVAVDPEGKRLALPNYNDGKIILYELATGKELATCPGHRGGTGVVVFSPYGKWLASAGKIQRLGGKDKRIRVWDAATLREVRSWQVEGDWVYQLQFTPNGKGLASVLASEDKEWEFRFWDAATGEEQPLRGALADVRVGAFCFSADGKTLLTGSNAETGGLLQLWDLATGKEVRTVAARIEGGIKQVALAPDGKSAWAITWYWPGNHKPQQWDLSTGKQLLSLAHPSYITQIEDFALSPDGKCLATGTYSHDVFLWDTTTGRRSSDFVGHRDLATAAAFTPDGQHLWTGGCDKTIRYWSAASGEQLRLLSQEGNKGGTVWTLALRPDGKMLAASLIHRNNDDPRKKSFDFRLWDLTSGKERELRHGQGDWVTAVAFSPDGRVLASRGEDPTIREMLASRGEDQNIRQTIRLWDVAAGKERARLRCEEAGAYGIAFSPDGRHLISALDKETIGFWDVQTGHLIRRLSVGLSGGIPIPLLSRDGRMLVTGGGEQPLRLWEVASGKERGRIERPDAKRYVVAALSPDGHILAWFDSHQPIKLWDLIADKQLGELGDRTNMAAVESLTFSRDSRRLASSHDDGTVLIWDVARLWPKADTAARISAKRLEELWNELASADAAKAYGAMRTLAALPDQSIPLLRQRLPKTTSANAEKIARQLADLDSEQFEVRERACRGLQELGMSAEAAMRRALRMQPSLEVRRRLEPILEKLESSVRTAEELRILRAVEVLEWITSLEARRFLEELARGSPDSWLTQEAKSSVQRLSEHSVDKP
jgi:RNA polymerase sigma factor (sigma-70 family)